MAVPDNILINEIEREYQGVDFSHKLHADMTAMRNGCQECHHLQKTEEISACKQCHPAEVTGEQLNQPGLKGAYHRQCLGCHQEWSGETACEMCHAKKSSPHDISVDEHSTLRASRLAPLDEPVKKVWNSEYGGGTVVTLHHRNHTEKYGVECAACHHQEGCGFCHGDQAKSQAVRHSESAVHAICNACHAKMSCDQCHLASEAPEFSHDRTDWPLGKFHEQLACKRCHGAPNQFTKPTRNCNVCHARWIAATFDHKRTQFALSENHLNLDCESCHIERNFAMAPMCASCHEDDINFPSALPGEYLR